MHNQYDIDITNDDLNVLQAENETDKEEWMSVLLNSKDRALNQAFADNGQSTNVNQSFLELQRTLVSFIRGLPGNDRCCDCGSQNGKQAFEGRRRI